MADRAPVSSARAPRLQDRTWTTRHEWLETNGAGGWASSTVSGMHTRRYHGLLVAALQPPGDRRVLVSRLDETLVSPDGRRFELGCNRFDDVVHPEGDRWLTRFDRGLFPAWTYRAGPFRLRRVVASIAGQQTTVVQYECREAPAGATIELRPFLAARDYHTLTHANENVGNYVGFTGDALWIRPYPGDGYVRLIVPDGAFDWDPAWHYRFVYEQETARGLDDHEDLWVPGAFSRPLTRGQRFSVVLTTERDTGPGETLVRAERKRRNALVRAVPSRPRGLQALHRAADAYLVRRSDGSSTVIAGYPWFGDWGRDTMIALPGLTLATGRHEEARRVLAAWGAALDRGMLPNRFPGGHGAPEFNTVDATLWMFVAVQRYLKATRDRAFVGRTLLPVLRDALEWHDRGTRHGIRVDADGLLRSGEPGVALTWMDARVDGRPVTPREGKPVEVQALWCNALLILSDLERRLGAPERAGPLRERGRAAVRRFRELFVREDAGLHDVIRDDGSPDSSIRPNQAIALALPHAVLARPEARAVLAAIEAHLRTPFGLRSLAPSDPAYRGHYGGGPAERDAAYHQGPAWGWLLGPYLSGLARWRGETGRTHARLRWQAALAGLTRGCLGQLGEIAEGDAPHAPRGAPAQAWSVAELLRVWFEDLAEPGP